MNQQQAQQIIDSFLNNSGIIGTAIALKNNAKTRNELAKMTAKRVKVATIVLSSIEKNFNNIAKNIKIMMLASRELMKLQTEDVLFKQPSKRARVIRREEMIQPIQIPQIPGVVLPRKLKIKFQPKARPKARVRLKPRPVKLRRKSKYTRKVSLRKKINRLYRQLIQRTKTRQAQLEKLRQADKANKINRQNLREEKRKLRADFEQQKQRLNNEYQEKLKQINDESKKRLTDINNREKISRSTIETERRANITAIEKERLALENDRVRALADIETRRSALQVEITKVNTQLAEANRNLKTFSDSIAEEKFKLEQIKKDTSIAENERSRLVAQREEAIKELRKYSAASAIEAGNYEKDLNRIKEQQADIDRENRILQERARQTEQTRKQVPALLQPPRKVEEVPLSTQQPVADKERTRSAVKKVIVNRLGPSKIAVNIVKSLPVIGITIGLVYASIRVFAKDYVGASAEVLSTFLSFASSIPVELALIIHDSYYLTYGVYYHKDDPAVRDMRLAILKQMAEEELEKYFQFLKQKEVRGYTSELDVVTAVDTATRERVEAEAAAEQQRAIEAGYEERPQGIFPRIGRAAEKVGDFLSAPFKLPSVTVTAGMTEFDKKVMNLIRTHEGVRYRPYKDSRGLWTVGIGHLIGDGRRLPAEWNREFTAQEIEALFEKDYIEHKKAAMKIPNWNQLTENQQAALIDLTFNLGPYWYNKFPKFFRYMRTGRIEEAARELENSLWYKQVGARAPRIVALIRDAGNGNRLPQEPTTGTTLAAASSEVETEKGRQSFAGPVIINTKNIVQTSVITSNPYRNEVGTNVGR